MKKDRIIIKLSGASFSKNGKNIIESEFINDIAKQLIKISSTKQIGIVIGGGNIWRGNLGNNLNMNQNVADSMGMLATTMNAIALANAISNNNGYAKVYSSINMEGLCDIFNYEKVSEFLDSKKGNIAIFAGGTGSPFFTTDTASALRACQLQCKTIYMGKNGVDGVYDDDPKKNPKAKRYDSLTYNDVLKKSLGVMDLTAITMCQQNNVELIVFNFDEKDSLIKVVNKKNKYTIIK